MGRLSADATRGPANRYTKDTEAYQEYVRGRYFWNKRSEEGFRKGIEHFKGAIEIDPAYPLVYAGLAVHLNSVVIRLKFDPRFDELRNDSRFKVSE